MVMTKAFPVDEVPQDSKKVVEIGEYKVLIIHTADRFYAVDNHCPHMKLPLLRGKVSEDHALTCAFHRSTFDLETGSVKEWTPWPPVVGKALGSLAQEKALPVFRTEVKDGFLWISNEPGV